MIDPDIGYLIMNTCLVHILLFAAWMNPASQTQPEADRPAEDDRRSMREDRREDRRERRRGDRGPRREDWDRYRNASPEERQKMRTERMVDMAARNYELSNEQRDMVRNEMEKMRQERKAQMGLDYDRYETLREQMFQYWQNRGEGRGPGPGRGPGGGDWDRMRTDPDFQKLREEMRALEQKYPFDWQASITRIEALLPPEQAAKGRERFERRRSRWDERRQRREAELQQDMLNLMQDTERAMADGNKEKIAELLNDASRRLDRERMSDEMKAQLRQQIEAARQRAGIDAPKVELAPEHPWEKDVREFVTRFNLSSAQQSSAAAILKDVRDRAAQIEITNAPRIAAAREIADAKEREATLKELSAPIEKLHQELMVRLDGLLTAEQRAKTPKK